MKVLVADDDPVYRQLLETTLTNWGYKVEAVADGAAALEILRRDDAPRLVLLDWMMPGIPGDQICREIRETTQDEYTYILMLSGKTEKKDLLKGLNAGADDYLIKPVDAAELKARLNTGKRILELQNALIQAREVMRRQATRDFLTGVWNHGAILEILEHEMIRAKRDNTPLGVILADLDFFKQVNDRYGHQAGDQVLREVTSRTVAAMRPYDLVGRYGGEEFLVLLPRCDREATLAVCDRIRESIQVHTVQYGGHSITLTMSFGATVYYPYSQSDSSTMVRLADDALYRAKAAGRNCVEFSADPSVPSRSESRT